MRFPLDHVCEVDTIDLKQFTKKDGAYLNFRQPLPSNPRECKALAPLGPMVQNRQIQQRRSSFQARNEIEANLMIWPSVMAEEIFDDTESFLDVDGSANLFPHLTDDRLCGMFSRLDPASGKTPEVVPLYLMQQHVFVLIDDGGSPQIETMTSGVKRNHDLELEDL
ncbi:hypothetical protein P3T24_006429 [Paraburkholderia sp. GAS33]|jgi:hypothetical protein